MTKIANDRDQRNSDADLEIITLPRGDTERLRVALATFKGNTAADVRIQYRAADGSWRPTKAGVRIRLEQLDDVIGALTSARDHLRRGEPS